jgi:hypothetical protein
MVKGLLANGDPMFVVSISHFVTIRAFATALSEEFYINSVPFPENLTKKKIKFNLMLMATLITMLVIKARSL